MFTGVVEHAYLEIVQSRLPGDPAACDPRCW